ncbi:hypothetical protein [Krasilnikovia sp. MM14-A1259]|uniref:hypothetical protein n=1 Tax=Krasilnikovia sp. MM14-A1259 TaxID=3373539 RepID=UPI003821C3AA
MARDRSYLFWVVPLFTTVVATAGCGGPNVGTEQPAAPAAAASQPGTAPPEMARKEQTTVEPVPAQDDTAPRCGQPVRAPAATALTVTGRFPTSVAANEQTVSGLVEVTSQAAVKGVGAPQADLFLVRKGRIVTEPMPQDAVGVRWDLAAGQSRKIPAAATLMSCEPGGDRLPPGDYEMYARVAITPDDAPTATSQGGPWPLELH